MLTKVNGLPAHILIVHAVVVLVPLAAVLAVVGAVWPAARRRIQPVTVTMAVAGLAMIPAATSAGEWLQEHIPDSALVRRHAELGDGLTVWALGLAAFAAVLWLLDIGHVGRFRVPSRLGAAWVKPVVSGALVIVAVMSVVQVYRIGDSGAKAAWDGKVSHSVITRGG